MTRAVPPAAPESRIRTTLKGSSSWYAAAVGAVEVARRAKSLWDERHNFTVAIDSDDPLYQDVSDWLLEQIPTSAQKALSARSNLASSSGYPEPAVPSGDPDERRVPYLLLTYDTKATVPIDLDGHRIRVSIQRPDSASLVRGRMKLQPDVIMFEARSADGRRAVVERLRAILTERRMDKREPQLWMLSSWGHWERRRDLPTRSLDSVVLAAGQMERLVADMGGFLGAETDYNKRGIPWRRGYLLHGPPGTGKTSIAKALAGHFGLDLWYAPLGDLDKDTSLLSLLSQVHPRSMLLLEDIDVYHAARDRDDSGRGVTLSGLLNALDGVATPHGLMFMLTTNDRDVLDDALLRSGRIDRDEHIDLPTMEQSRRLFERFYGFPPTFPWSAQHVGSTADLVELFKRHMDDPAGAELTLVADPQLSAVSCGERR